jgi:hypothetical protein
MTIGTRSEYVTFKWLGKMHINVMFVCIGCLVSFIINIHKGEKTVHIAWVDEHSNHS